MVYFFYPETEGIELEDVPLLFAKGGVTGGVLTSKGKTITPHQHANEVIAEKGDIQNKELEEIKTQK
jgi:hypothetical protein